MYKIVDSVPLFEVSESGDIRRTDNGKHPKPWKDKDGYLRVYATKGGIKHYIAVHRAVAEAWVGEPLGVVNHLDGNKQNNHHSNL